MNIDDTPSSWEPPSLEPVTSGDARADRPDVDIPNQGSIVC